MAEQRNTLDVRTITPRERHPLIFSRLDALQVGETLFLVNDHDPRPLYYQIQAEHPGQFSWDPQIEGPEKWVIRIGRIAKREQ